MKYGRVSQFTFKNLIKDYKTAGITATIIFGSLGIFATILLSDIINDFWSLSITLTALVSITAISTLFIVNQHLIIKFLHEKDDEFIETYFDNLLRVNTETLKIALKEAATIYPQISGKTEKNDSESINEVEYEKQTDKILECWRSVFDSVCYSVKEAAEYYLKINDVSDVEVSVCIKHMTKPFIKDNAEKPSETFENDLESANVFAIRRDYKSLNRREIGTLYTVMGNTTFRKCISSPNPSKAFYKGNNLKKKFDAGDFQSENKEFYKDYDCTVCLPIYYDGDEIIYYGFLTIDCNDTQASEVLTKSNNIVSIMKPFADILAILYSDATLYFDEIFSHLINNKTAIK